MKKIKTFENRRVMIIYIICNVVTFLTVIGSIITGIVNGFTPKTFEHLGLCLLALGLFNLPVILRVRYKLHIPSFLQITVMVFAVAHFILGEIMRGYDYSVILDKALHTTSGVIFGICGFSLINGLNSGDKPLFKLSPFFVAVFSFCFSLAISYLWEIFEFSADVLFGANMQRWQDGHYIAIVNGEERLIENYGQGSGILDTMGDLVVNLIGAVVISIIGYIWLKRKSNAIESILIKPLDIEADTTIKNTL